MDFLQRRLQQYASLDDQVWDILTNVTYHQQAFAKDEDIIRTGDPAESLFVISAGWAIRYRITEDGRRQIVNFMLPGDIFDIQALADLDADHNVSAITSGKLIRFDRVEFLKTLRSNADLASAFWWAAVQEESILREQIVRVGRRSAKERIGHLLLELERRFVAIEDTGLGRFPLPLSRLHIADALGLTLVHVSRTISALKRADLIDEASGILSILDRPKLVRLSQFDDDYLHARRLNFANSDASPSLRAQP